MNENIKYRLIGLSLIVAMALLFLPVILKGRKPSWVAIEDSRSFKIPAAPKPIKVALSKPNKNWLKPMQKIIIVSDQRAQKIIQLAKSKFSTRQQELDKLKTPVKIVQLAKKLKPKFKKLAIVNNRINKPLLIVNTVKRKGALPAVIIAKNLDKTIKRHSYYLQLATFLKLNFANNMLQKLKKAGYKSYISESSSKHGQLYALVLDEKIAEIADVRVLQDKINKMFKIKSLIIKKTKRA